MIDQCYITCVGNPGAKFEPVALARKGEFTNVKGS